MSKAKPKTQKSHNSKKKANEPTLTLKERLAQKRQAQLAKQKLIQTVVIAVFLTIVVGLPLMALDVKLGLAGGLGLPCLFFSYQYPRTALWAFLIYLPFNGTVTYWVGGGNALFQLAKDAFYIPALLALVRECQQSRKPLLVSKKLVVPLSILLSLSLLTLFVVNGYLEFFSDASGHPFLQGILGLKVLLGYVPLIFCAYYLIEDKKQLLFLARLHLILAIICCLLSFAQYWMLDTGRCVGTRNATGQALFEASLEAKCLVGGALTFSPSQGQIRLPGTFVSPWHWAWFLISNSAFAYAVAFFDTAAFWRLVGIAGLAIDFMAAVISGQRIALFLVPVVFMALLVLTGQIANLKKFIPIAIGLGLLLIGIAASNPEVMQERWESAVGRWKASPPHAFIEEQFHWSIKQQKGPLGRGVGRATNSTRVFGEAALVETFHPKLLYEIGPFGTLAFVAFTTQISIVTFQCYRSVRDRSLRSFGSAYWVFIFIISYFPYWYPLDTDPVAVYYWFFAGVILKLPDIEQQEEEKLKAAQDSEPEPKQKKGRKGRSRKAKARNLNPQT